MFLTTLTVAGAAGYFSVYGLAKVFSGSFISVILMGAGLEAGKLMAASFLYRYWKYTSWFLKLPLIFLIFALMILTSLGISGYLTSSYQVDTLEFKSDRQTVELYEKELEILTARKAEMDKQISDLPADYITAKQRLITTFKPEYDKMLPRIQFLTQEIQTLKSKNIEIQSKVGPIIFISETLGLDPDKSVIWLTFFIVLIFDPLAVCLTIATNIAVVRRNEEKKESTITPQPHQVAVPQPIKKVTDDVNTSFDIVEPNFVSAMDQPATDPSVKQIINELNVLTSRT
jgi:cell division protein FtsB